MTFKNCFTVPTSSAALSKSLPAASLMGVIL
jgi:hypothetical protein